MDENTLFEGLRECRNIFDIAACFYAACEDNPSNGWRFETIDTLNRNDSKLDNHFADCSERIVRWLRRKFEQASINNILSGISPNPKVLGKVFSNIFTTIPHENWSVPWTAWLLLRCIDQVVTSHFHDLIRINRNGPVDPLNSNYNNGFPRVFVKMSGLYENQLTRLPHAHKLASAQRTQRRAVYHLECLAFTLYQDSDIHVISCEGLQSDFKNDPKPVVAVVIPKVEPECYHTHLPGTESSASRVFWVELTVANDYKDKLIDALRRVDESGAMLVVMPELSTTPDIVEVIRKHAKSTPYKNLKLLVVGSYHTGPKEEAKDNIAIVLDRFGNILLGQKKRVPFEQSGHHGGNKEWITNDNPQILLQTPIGSIAVMICVDYLDDKMPVELSNIGCHWFLVPACTKCLEPEFREKTSTLGRIGKAISVIANNPWMAEGNDSSALVYRPVAGKQSNFVDGQKLAWSIIYHLLKDQQCLEN